MGEVTYLSLNVRSSDGRMYVGSLSDPNRVNDTAARSCEPCDVELPGQSNRSDTQLGHRSLRRRRPGGARSFTDLKNLARAVR